MLNVARTVTDPRPPFNGRLQRDGRLVIEWSVVRALGLVPDDVVELEVDGCRWLSQVKSNGRSRSLAARISIHVRAALKLDCGALLSGHVAKWRRRA